MKRVWMAAVAMAAAAAAQAGSRKPQADALVTVFTYDRVRVPEAVMERAKLVAARALAAAGIEVRWVEGKQLGEPRLAAAGDVLTVAFDGPAPAHLPRKALAATHLSGRADADVQVFCNRVADAEDGVAAWSPAVHVSLPDLMGNVLAHELTHALEGVARHSSKGLMMADWSAREYTLMMYGPLPLAAEDLRLLRVHFKREMSPTPTLASAR